VWYTIECLSAHDSERPRVMAMVFRDREAALASACALMSAGFSVSKVEGPGGFRMSRTSLVAYHQSRHRKPDLV